MQLLTGASSTVWSSDGAKLHSMERHLMHPLSSCHFFVVTGATAVAPAQLSVDAASGSQLLPQLGSKTLPFIQPGCNMMFMPDRWCLPLPSPFVKGCCTPGYSCTKDWDSLTGFSCQPVEKQQLSYSYEQSKGVCTSLVDIGDQCGGAGFDCYKYNTCDQFGPWLGFCCPNGYTCQPYSKLFRKWTCQVDVQDQPPGKPSVVIAGNLKLISSSMETTLSLWHSASAAPQQQ